MAGAGGVAVILGPKLQQVVTRAAPPTDHYPQMMTLPSKGALESGYDALPRVGGITFSLNRRRRRGRLPMAASLKGKDKPARGKRVFERHPGEDAIPHPPIPRQGLDKQ